MCGHVICVQAPFPRVWSRSWGGSGSCVPHVWGRCPGTPVRAAHVTLMCGAGFLPELAVMCVPDWQHPHV